VCGLHLHNFFVLFVSFSFCCEGFSFSYAYVCGLWFHVEMGFILINKKLICPFGFKKIINHVYALEEILLYATNHYVYVDYNCMLCFLFSPLPIDISYFLLNHKYVHCNHILRGVLPGWG
jgi:hypothetical protein